MTPPSELDLAALRLEFRRLYQDLGYVGCLQVLYELLISTQTLANVIAEEMKREREEDDGMEA